MRGWLPLKLRVHPWMCQSCRAFLHNDGVLTGLLSAQRQQWKQWEPPPGDAATGRRE